MAEPLAIAFANTRSSINRDRIATLDDLRTWSRSWPLLAGVASGIRPDVLGTIHALRDATQLVLHSLADGESPLEKDLERATRAGLEPAAFRLHTGSGGIELDIDDDVDAVIQLLSRAVVDFLMSPQVSALRHCQGADCRKVFTSDRADRRWCDSRVCGNRARVAAYARRQV